MSLATQDRLISGGSMHTRRNLRIRSSSAPRAWSAISIAALAVASIASISCTQEESLDESTRLARFEAQGRDTTAAPGDRIGGTTSALLGTTPSRTRTIAGMMFDIGTGPPNMTTLTTLITGPGSSQRHMFVESSFGLQDLQTDFFGPFTLPVQNCLTIACCGPSSDRTGNGATVAMEIAALSKTYDHYFWLYGTPSPQGSSCGTWGDEGRPNKPAVYSNYSFDDIVGFAQELGHNFGMTHEPTMTCPGNAAFLDDPTQCTHVEYGNALSFMGNGAHHPSAYHKYAQGWIGKCNVVTASSGTFTLVPQELPCDGVQLLQVPAPKTRMAPGAGTGGQARQGQAPMLSNYYLEMRGKYGFDSTLTQPMVIISVGAGFPTQNAAAPYLYLLDLTPEAGRANLNNAGLMTVGQSYTDPAGGLTFTLMAIDNTSATVSITGGTGTAGPTCVDMTPFTAPGPGASSCSALATISGDGGVTGPTDARPGTGGAPGTGGRTGTGGTGAGTGGRAGGTGGVTGAGGNASGAGGAATGSGGSSGAAGAKGGGASGGCSCDSGDTTGRFARGLDLAAVALISIGLVLRRRSRRGQT
jgi:hypothetical protein